MSSNVGDVVLKLVVQRDFHEVVRMWGLILSNPIVCSVCFFCEIVCNGGNVQRIWG